MNEAWNPTVELNELHELIVASRADIDRCARLVPAAQAVADRINAKLRAFPDDALLKLCAHTMAAAVDYFANPDDPLAWKFLQATTLAVDEHVRGCPLTARPPDLPCRGPR